MYRINVFPLKFRPKESLIDVHDFMTDHEGSQNSGKTVSQELRFQRLVKTKKLYSVYST